MANNPYVNKVEYAGQTVMDLTGDTVQPSSVLNGVTFHDRSGAPQTGSMITHNVYDGLDSTSTNDALSAKQGKVLNDNLATLGTTLTGAWTAESSSASGTQLTDSITLTKGIWLLFITVPVVDSGTPSVAFAPQYSYVINNQLSAAKASGDQAIAVVSISTSVELYAMSGSSSSVTFNSSYLSRGGIRAVKIGL